MKKLKVAGFILAIIELFLSIAVICDISETKMVPARFIILLGVLLFLIFAITIFFSKRKKKAFKISAISIAAIMCLTLCVAMYYLRVTNRTIDKVTGVKTEVDEINVYVKVDDEVSTINEAVEKNYVFATVATDDQEHIDETIQKIEKDVGKSIQTKQFDSIFELVGNFDNGVVNSIITNKGTLLALESSEDYADYSQNLKVIMEKTFEEKIETEEVKTGDKDHFCMYFSGIDTFGAVTQRSRSDVNIVAVVNNKTKNVLLVSTPRDYYVTLSSGQKDKLTHAGIYGIDCSMDTLEDFYDTELKYYVRLNFSGFQNIINQLGGIDVYSEYSFVSETAEGTYSYVQGVNHLNGEEALGFARARHAFKDGDRQRGRNQMQVIKATIEKLESSEMLRNYANVMDQMEGSFQTDMEKDTVGYLVQSTIDEGNWTVLTYSVGGSDSSQKCYSLGSNAYVMIPNEEDVKYAKELIDRVLADEKVTQDEINVYIEKKDAEDVINQDLQNEDTTEED